MAERILPVYEHVLGQEMAEAAGTAIGAASVCWESMEGTGVFDSDRAAQILDELMGVIVQYARQYAADHPQAVPGG